MKKGRRPRRRPRLKLSDKAGPDQCPVPGENALFPAQIAGFLAVSRPVPVYPAFLKYVVSVQRIFRGGGFPFEWEAGREGRKKEIVPFCTPLYEFFHVQYSRKIF